ncbi:ABC transporter ATP-binding protein [Paraferrimonas sedimenticola]|uniref:Methionine ABC transporter ATP-binding protein n=1 Tax=Paraferrimonas sedimenticola TaxID=375674 RepID=A0AA37RV51_9GAMM|nr:ABC transporter ATP-binding protein [Paraferrimonas sedimenticola]GLP96275.1 methionine ABC transporter ATP-binding protein [Paraferrimonas sedimenticola]
MSLLSLSDIRFRWPNATHDALQIDSLDVQANERVFLYGPSGCGKSTLLSLIVGVVAPQSGKLEMLGQSLAELSSAKRDQFRADHIGYVFQQFNLLPYLSVLQNVTLACQFSKTRTAKAIKRSGTVAQEARRLLNQLQLPGELIDSPVNELSIGQQQRVAAARALIGSPELIIADEPTSALDKVNRQRFMELLLTEIEHAGSSLIMVSHDEQLLEHFQKDIHLPSLNKAVQHGLD